MKARARKRRQKHKLPKSIVLILQTGHDFFQDLPGGVTENLDLLRRAWADEEIRAAVYDRHRAKHPEGGLPWAARKFDEEKANA